VLVFKFKDQKSQELEHKGLIHQEGMKEQKHEKKKIIKFRAF
jgi:hypothetical protein